MTTPTTAKSAVVGDPGKRGIQKSAGSPQPACCGGERKAMSRIGKKPITLPKGVTFQVVGNVVTVKGPKGSVSNHVPGGVALEQQDGLLLVKREDDSKAAVHGLVRALVNNAVQGVTTGWTRELE